MRTLENPVLYEELVGPMVCWLEIELSLIESTYDVPALMLVLQPGHSGGKCDVIGPKKHVPMGTKVGKVPNKLHQQHLHNMWTFRPDIFLAPGVPRGDPKFQEPISLDPKNFFLAEIL